MVSSAFPTLDFVAAAFTARTGGRFVRGGGSGKSDAAHWLNLRYRCQKMQERLKKRDFCFAIVVSVA
jgi:hypothetical protein